MKTKCYRMHLCGLGELGRNSIYYSGTREQRWQNVEGNKDIIGNRELENMYIYQGIWEQAILFKGIKRTC